MKRWIGFLGMLVVSSHAFGWGAPEILPADQRAKTYAFETKNDKKKGFQKTAIWAAKTFVNANESIKMKDADLGVLIAKGNLSCKALKMGNGFGENQRIEFTLEITIEDKKAEAKVSDVLGRADGAYDDAARPSKKEEVEAAAKDCIDPFIELFKKGLD